MSRIKRRYVISFAVLAALLLGHAVLVHVMADRQIVTQLLSPGGHTATGAAVTAIAFLLLRLTVILFLPAFVVCRVGLLVMDRIANK